MIDFVFDDLQERFPEGGSREKERDADVGVRLAYTRHVENRLDFLGTPLPGVTTRSHPAAGGVTAPTPISIRLPPPLLLLGHVGTADAEIGAVAEVDAETDTRVGSTSPAVWGGEGRSDPSFSLVGQIREAHELRRIGRCDLHKALSCQKKRWAEEGRRTILVMVIGGDMGTCWAAQQMIISGNALKTGIICFFAQSVEEPLQIIVRPVDEEVQAIPEPIGDSGASLTTRRRGPFCSAIFTQSFSHWPSGVAANDDIIIGPSWLSTIDKSQSGESPPI
ncbi:hypothetical protein EDB86DRAFT_3242438 [Lactarius hatsudake]|nr:hypothetical protein EDB86DRAFT_3242438 [Lactarius hatsudake]